MQSQKTSVRSTEPEKPRDSVQSFLKTEAALDAERSSRRLGLSKDSAKTALSLRNGIWANFQALFHLLSAPYPRLLPDTDEKIAGLKRTLVKFYGLEDRPDVWLTVFGQIAGRPITSNRISYRRLAIAGRRLTSNAVIKKHKDLEIGKLNARLEEIVKEMAAEEPAVSSETHDLPRDLQTLPGASPGMVSNAGTQDGLY